MASPLRKPKFQPLQLSAVWILPVGGGAFLRRWANFRDGDHSNSGGKTVAAAITVAAMRSFRVQGSTLLEEHYRCLCLRVSETLNSNFCFLFFEVRQPLAALTDCKDLVS